MKRVLFFVAIAWSLGSASPSLASQPPWAATFPDFDRRLDRLPLQPPELSPEQADAAAVLRERVAGVNLHVDRLLGSPSYVASPRGFLTGPQGAGKATTPAVANAFAAADPQRPLKAFLREHADLFGYGPEILDTAVATRDYVTPHNGLRTTVWEQRLDGVAVFEAVLLSHVTKNGELVNVSTRLVPDVLSAAARGVPNHAQVLAAPPISAQLAIVAAAQGLETSLAAADVLPVSDPAPSPDQEQRFTSLLLQGQAIAKLTWVPMGRGRLRICWQVFLASRARPIELYRCLVDAQTGAVIARHGLTRSLRDATYNVYTSDSPSPFSPGHPIPLTTQPPYVSRVLVTTPALDTNASPLGWIADNDNETKGNNVDAHMDWNADGLPDLPRPQGTNRVFDFPLDLTLQPDTYGPASTVQLFYWANWMHDMLYELGFTEAAGNFQDFNFGRGGYGGDAVLASCQFGLLSNTPAFRNNAFFSAMPDGYPGAMLMLIYDGPNPNRDSSLDAEVVLHECTHGLSQRLVGGGVLMSMLQPNGMGEGWSDFYALALLSEPGDNVNGNYAWGPYAGFQLNSNNFANYYYGCRRYPYTTDLGKNPLTFKDIDPTQADPHLGIPMNPIYRWFTNSWADEVHFQGEFWAVTLWEARVNLIRKYGFTNGNHMILQLVTDGMRLAPADPTYIQARDAIIQADLVNYGGANVVELWTAFAKRGLGGSAFAPDSSTTVGVIEAFDMPGLVFVRASSSDAATGNGNGAIDPNECTEVTVVIANNGANRAASIQATLSSLDANVVVAQAESRYPNLLPGDRGTNLAPFRIYTRPQMTCGQSIQLALMVRSDVDVRTVRFRLDTGSLGTPTRFDSTNSVDIPDVDPAGVDSPITVSGFAGPVGKVTVSLHITHDRVGDLVLQLIGPDGTSATLVDASSKNGTNYGNACAPVSQRTTFDDKAAVSILTTNAPYVGAFKPLESLVRFAMKSGPEINGTWRLHVTDVLTNYIGTVQCWSLNLFPLECTDGGGECPSDLAVYASPGPTLPVVGSNWTFTVTVANEGPNIARGVMLTNVLPAGVRYLTNDAGCNLSPGGAVICSLGNVPNGNAANIHITVVPQVEGPATNSAVVTTLTPELALTNNSATFTTLVRPAAPLVVSAGARLDAESFSPPSGAIDIGETVTLQLILRNIGVLGTSNLVATLLSANGITSPSGPQAYGALLPEGPAVSRPFTFTAAGTNGGVVIATLQLQDGLKNLGTVAFTFGLSSALSYSTSGGMNIPDQGPAALYPSPIFVSGLAGRISQLSVTLSGLSHSCPADLDVLLVGPGGQRVMLLSDAGGGAALQNATLTFADNGYRLTDPQERLASGTYHPADFDPGDVLPAPAPIGPYATELTSLNGLEPNGTWSLYVFDDSAGDSGRLNGGWTLDFKMFDPVNPTADLQLTVTNWPPRPLVGSNILYTVTVVNRGPDPATGVLVTNYPPAALANIVPTAAGACVVTNGTVICQLGSVSNLATMTIAGKITASGVQVFGATVGGNEQDSNASNNTNWVAADVQPLADVGVWAGATPAPVTRGSRFAYQVVVTNRGPDAATALRLTNTLPAQVKLLSAAGDGWSISATNRLVRGLLAALPAGGQSLLTIMCEAPDLVTLLTNTVTVGAGAPADLVGSNNTASVVVQVRDPEVFIVAAGSTLAAEAAPPTGGIEPGERVTINFALRNMGIADTLGLTAALREAGGVTAPTGPADYGVLVAGGLAVERPFAFTAAGTAGSTLVATLDLRDGTNNLGAVTFPFILGGAQGAFANTNRIFIADKSPALPYPSVIVVSGLTGAVGKLTVTLTGLTHAYPDDLDALLVGPQGQGVILMSDAGGGNAITNLTLTFDDDADRSLPDNSPLESGRFKPGNYPPGDLFPAPAPEGPYGALLANFRGVSPNGPWSLYLVDDFLGDDGSLDAWSLTITTVGLIAQAAPGAATRLLNAVIGPDGRFQFTIQANPGEVYEVQTSPDLQTWTPAGTCAVGAGTGQYTDPQAPDQPQRFYRAVRLPQ